MKRLVSLVLCAGLLFSAVACGNKTSESEKTSEKETVSVEEEELGITFAKREMKTDGQLYTGGNVNYSDELWQTPEVEYDSSLDYGNVKGIFITSPVKYNGKPVKIMGYIGFPEGATKEDKCPAIVLVHGGGGTAFPDWVQMWNDRGYAAIAIDTEGGQSSNQTNMDNGAHVERNKYNVESLPNSLENAIEAMEADDFVAKTLGSHVYSQYVNAKKKEWHLYTTRVSQWEIDQYLTNF